MDRIPFYQVDAFTATPFAGNPAAVCLPAEPLPPAAMQRIAAEMNLSETAFPEPPDPEGRRRLRWFTPTTEVPLCGHATLASAHVLFGMDAPSPLVFESAAGPLAAHREEPAAGGTPRIRLDFPADPPEAADPPAGLLMALGIRVDPVVVVRGTRAWLVRIGSAGEVRELEPDFRALRGASLGEGDPLGVTVTAPGGGADGDVDFVSRFFAPWKGVDEDPVTGAAHTVLTPYWAEALGKERMRARQVSARGGELEVALAGQRVRLTGAAVTVAEGTVVVPGP